MRAVPYFVVFLVGLSTAANAPPKGPVYTPMNNPTNNLGKSSHSPSIVSSVPSTPNNTPVAEERESQVFRQEPGAAPASHPDASPTQSYMVYYYPNPNAKASYPGQAGYGAPANSGSSTSFMRNIPYYDIASIVGSLALIGGGSYLTYRKFGTVKSRALRELQDIKAEDAARMAKGVMRALERVYEMSSSK